MSIRLTIHLVFGVGMVALVSGAGPSTGKPEVRRDGFGDPLPAGALFRIGTIRLQHGAAVRAIAASPDGKRLASVGYDGSLSIWEVRTGREVYRRQCRDKGAGFLAFTPDSMSLLFHHDEALCLLDVETGKVRKQLGDFAYAGVFSADGKTLTTLQTLISESGIWSTTIRRVDAETGNSLKKWTLRFAPLPSDGIVVGAGNEFLVRHSLSSDGQLLATVEVHHYNSTEQKQTLLLHDALTGKELRRWQPPAPHVHALVVTADNKFLITAGADTTRVWDVATGKEVRRWTADPKINYTGVRITMAPDGDTLFSSGPRSLICWAWRTGKKLQTYDNASGPFAILNGGKGLALLGHVSDAERSSSILILDAATGKDLCPLPRPGRHVAFSPIGCNVAWPEGGALVVADAATGAELRRWQAHKDGVGPLAFAPDGKTLASAGADKRIRLWNVADGTEIRSMPHEWVSWLQFAADGKRLASVARWHKGVCIWDVRTGERQNRWQGDRLTALDPGVRVVAVADRKAKVLRLSEVATGKMLHALPNYQESVGFYYSYPKSISESHGEFPPLFAPDGRLLLAGGQAADGNNDGAVCFWDVAAGKRLPPILDGKKFMFRSLAFSPDSKLLALSRSDRMMCLMNPATGDVVRVLGMGVGPMTALPAFTPDARVVVTVVRGLVQIWEVATGGEICRRQGDRGDIDGLVVSGDGRALATVAWDHTILVWGLARLVSDDRPTNPLAAVELDALWKELTSPNAVKGRRAIETLVAVPGQAVALLRKRLSPVPAPDPKQLTRWIGDLGADEFEPRRQAAEALEQLGEAAAPALRQAIAGKVPLEARRRMEDLLKKMQPGVLPPDALRVVRSVQVLEAIGSSETQQLLQELARGAAGARLTEEAAAALNRQKQ